MMGVFVDTAAWVALFNDRDTLHSQATQIKLKMDALRVWFITTEFVLLEVADALSTARFRSRTIYNINLVRTTPSIGVVPFSQALLDSAWHLYSHRLDKDWSLTDCTSFVVMGQEGIQQAFTSDHHFVQAGFITLL